MIERRIPTTKSARPNPAAKPSQPAAPSPSVPISVVRELSADLQTTTANVTALAEENQQLAAQNQQLRQDLADLADQTQCILKKIQADRPLDAGTNAALPSKQLDFDAESAHSRAQMLAQLYRAMPNYAPTDRVSANDAAVVPVANGSGITPQPLPKKPKFNVKVKRSKLVAEQAQNPLRSTLSAQGRQLSGWRLTLIMALVVVSAFGAGFLLVRPLISTNTSR